MKKPNFHSLSYLQFFCLILLCLTFAQCKEDKKIVIPKEINLELGHGYELKGNGKIQNKNLDSVFTKVDLGSFDLPIITKELADGLRQQLKLLKYRKKRGEKYSELNISKEQLTKTIKTLLTSQFNNSFGIQQALDAYQIWGEDKKGNVHFTGYFTPVLKVRKKPNKIYKYPLYRYPKGWEGQLPTRQEIENDGALDSLGLEIAYAKSKLDIYFMQVQGSGYVEYPNGKRELLAHAGSNKHRYRSIGKYMIRQKYVTKEHVSLKSIKNYFLRNPDKVDSILYINSSYVFFTPVTTKPRGAGYVKLTPDYSIAVDRSVVPLGSCLLASIPILDERRNFSHHEYRILLAQDIGGAIKGTGHVDLYSGIGKIAKSKASALHHYGNLWLLLPKER